MAEDTSPQSVVDRLRGDLESKVFETQTLGFRVRIEGGFRVYPGFRVAGSMATRSINANGLFAITMMQVRRFRSSSAFHSAPK